MSRTGFLKGDEVAGAAGVSSQSTASTKDEIRSGGDTSSYLKSCLGRAG
jgi:hypothetical protein